MTEEAIERQVCAAFDSLDDRYMRGLIDTTAYNAGCAAITTWAEAALTKAKAAALLGAA